MRGWRGSVCHLGRHYVLVLGNLVRPTAREQRLVPDRLWEHSLSDSPGTLGSASGAVYNKVVCERAVTVESSRGPGSPASGSGESVPRPMTDTGESV